ncbi:heavy metal translocating P-type ATPase, partial [Amycolatopsis sp. H6(2020)]|nr:heavy metal translocating P-type ATPase [Amycolatopsis sp. H6(2020)]
MTDPNAHQHHHGDTADAPAHSGHAVATTAPGHGEDPHAGHAGHVAHQGQHGDHAGHGGHGGHGDHVGQFRRLFWINLVIAAPVVGLSPMFAMLLGYSVPGWAGWVAAVLGTVMYVWGGKPFLTGAWSELRS